jgi:hypothetical protein
LLDLQLSYSSVGTVLFKNLEICVLKQQFSNTKWCRPRRRAVMPRPRHTRAPRPWRSHPCAARGILRLRPAATQGRAAPEASCAPRRAGVGARATRRRTTRALPTGRALLRSGGPSATSRPRASYYGRGITPSSPLVGPPIFKCSPLLLAPPTSLPPFHRAAVAAAWQAVASPRL